MNKMAKEGPIGDRPLPLPSFPPPSSPSSFQAIKNRFIVSAALSAHSQRRRDATAKRLRLRQEAGQGLFRRKEKQSCFTAIILLPLSPSLPSFPSSSGAAQKATVSLARSSPLAMTDPSPPDRPGLGDTGNGQRQWAAKASGAVAT